MPNQPRKPDYGHAPGLWLPPAGHLRVPRSNPRAPYLSPPEIACCSTTVCGTRRVRVDRFVLVADRWSRCGGGHPDAIWASFGLNEVEFFTRVLAITDSDDAESAVLLRVARRRLWLCR